MEKLFNRIFKKRKDTQLQPRALYQMTNESGEQEPPEVGRFQDRFTCTGCSIPNAEHCAISIKQLEKFVMEEIESRCSSEKWTNREKELLTPDTVCLYDVNIHIIKKYTEERKCSFVELFADGPQKPQWFVSHWWGEPVSQFIDCLKQHAADRCLDEENTYYWVCAYANNQWALSKTVTSDPADSSFYKAMSIGVGTVSIVDPKCVAFTRIWCNFEIYTSLIDLPANYLFDIYTAHIHEYKGPKKAVGITDGYTKSDQNAGWMTYRQRHFPLIIGEREVFSFDVCKAESSYPEDRMHILNSIVGRKDADLEKVPPESNEMYDTMNNVLKGRLVSSIWVRLVERGNPMTAYGPLLQSSQLNRILLNFDKVQNFDDDAADFLCSYLPSSLKEMQVYLPNTSVGVNGTKALYALPSKLQQLTRLAVWQTPHGCAAMSSLAAAIRNTTTLETLELNDNQLTDHSANLLLDAIENNNSLKKILLMNERNLSSEIKEQLSSKAKGKGIQCFIY